MDRLLGSLLDLLPGLGIVGLLIIILLLNPEKIEKWSAMLWFVLARFGTLFKGAHKKYVKHDLQARINTFVKTVAADIPGMISKKVDIEWVSGDITRKSFLQDGKVIVRLRRDDPQQCNFVHGAYLFVSTSLLYKAKRYISPSQREAIDLYITSDLLKLQKPGVRDFFLEEYLHPRLAAKRSKRLAYFDQFARIHTGGLFYPVLLQELDFLGSKVFGGPKDDRLIHEADSLIGFLKDIASRTIGEETDLEFVRKYCRCAIVIIGRPSKLLVSTTPYIEFIRQHLIPEKIENIYVVGKWDNRHPIDEICQGVGDTYDIWSSGKSKGVLKYKYPDREIQIEQYSVVLRLRGVRVFQPSEA